MSYIPLHLRYRPQSFEQIIGQEHVSRTLQNAVASGRVVHAYLFAGPRGTGKTSTARVLAKALLCEKGPTPQPCNECSICRAITEGRCMDVVEIDAASNRGIEQIRELREKVKYSPAQARFKVYILDEVHMLTPEAFNALLKTLEEPPEHAYFVLATTELHKVPPTIVSRCQLFEFRLIPAPRIVEALKKIAAAEGVEADEEALEAIAAAARGALRDAESIFDQVIAFAGGPVTREIVDQVLGATPQEVRWELVKAMAEGDMGAVFGRLDELVAEGKDLAQLLADTMAQVRELMRLSLTGDGQGEMAELARKVGYEKLARGLHIMAEAERRLRETSQQQLLLELTFAEVAAEWTAPGARERAREVARAAASAQAPASHAASGRREATAAKARAAKAQTAAQRSRVAKAPAPPVSGELSVDVVKQQWQRIEFEFKRRRRPAVWALVRESQPVEAGDGRVVLEFQAKNAFHCERVVERYMDVVEEVFSAVLGQQVTVECRLEGEGEEASEGQARQPAQAATGRQPDSEPPRPLEIGEEEGEAEGAGAAEEAAEEQAGEGAEEAEEAAAKAEEEQEAEKGKSAAERAVEQARLVFGDIEDVQPEAE